MRTMVPIALLHVKASQQVESFSTRGPTLRREDALG